MSLDHRYVTRIYQCCGLIIIGYITKKKKKTSSHETYLFIKDTQSILYNIKNNILVIISYII